MNERQESARPGQGSGRSGRGVVLLAVLALLGAGISLMLTRVHLSHGQGSSGLFRLGCSVSGGGCEQVLGSSWALLPGNVPVALAGLVYFSAIAVWYLVAGSANRAGRRWALPVLALQLLGGLVSLLLLAVMATQVRALCVWCLLVHILNLVLLWLAWRRWPRGSREAAVAGEPARPAPRLAAAALLLMAAAGALWMLGIGNSRLEARLRAAKAETERFHGDADLMRYLHLRSRPQAIPVRPDDAVLGSASAPHTVVVFSDFQCPACQSFAAFFQREVRPALGGRLRLVYKHFPLDTDCNPNVVMAVHANACEAAHAAEAARELGGAQGFWRMHDVLFERQEDVAEGRWAELATAAGLDGAAVAERVARRSHRDRIAEDVRLGMALKLDGTPSLYVDGRYLEDWTNIEVWRAILAQD
jgi:protein-disulfide isomerase/uncharacterized membrane protein